MNSTSSSGVEEPASDSNTQNNARSITLAYDALSGPPQDSTDNDLCLAITHRRGRSKRKWRTRHEKWNYLQQFYSDGYQQLLRGEADASAQVRDDEEDTSTDPGPVGGISWTSLDKTRLFDALSKKGRFDLPTMSAAINSKSVVEVQAYIRKLQDSTLDTQDPGPHQANVAIEEYPAAVEIETKTDHILEKAADALCMYQEHYENAAGRKAHGDFWLTDYKTAQKHESELDHDADSEGREPGILPASAFFRLPAFLELSETVFMNQSNPTSDQNWRKIAISDERPAVTYDCLADLYNIVVSLTRRLVQTTLFTTSARLRASRRGEHASAKLIKRQDAIAAIDTLKLKRNSFRYWQTAPRRCGVQIARVRKGRGFTKGLMTYDEAEIALGRPVAKRRRLYWDSTTSEDDSTSGEAMHEGSDNFADADEDSAMHEEGYVGSESSLPSIRGTPSDLSENENDLDSETLDDKNSKDIGARAIRLNLPARKEYDESQREGQHEAYAEQMDLAASHAEEARLLEILGYESGFGTEAQPSPLLTGEPSFASPFEDLTADWKDTFLPRNAWEDYSEPVGPELFTPIQYERVASQLQAESTSNSNASLLPSNANEDGIEDMNGVGKMETEGSQTSTDEQSQSESGENHSAASTSS